MADIIVVGGGPAGSLSASMLAADGRDVVMLEEHDKVGLPVHCAGVVSDSFLRSIPVSPEIVSCIRHARVVFPGGRTFDLERSSPFGYMIDRTDLDQKLADYAVKNGVDLRLGTCYNTVIRNPNSVTVVTNKGEIDGDLLVGADGENSAVAASIGAGYSKEYLIGYQVDVKCRSDEPDTMVLKMGNKVAPGLFAWKIPKDDDTIRYGLCVSPGVGSPVTYIRSLLKADGFDFETDVVVKYGGRIPLGYRSTTVGERTLLIGDAASHVKPVSAGGLVPIATIAPILRDTIHEAYENNLFTKAVLGQYEVEWKRAMGHVFDRGMQMRKLYCGLSDRMMDEVGGIFDTPEIREYLAGIDIDDPAGLVRPILQIKGVKRKLATTFLKAKICRK